MSAKLEVRNGDDMKIKEHGPWTARASGNDHVLGVFVESDDFTHDVRLYVNGDFASLEERFAYAEEIAKRLNSWAVDNTQRMHNYPSPNLR